MITVGVLGAGGKMGSEVCRAVADDEALRLVAAVDPDAAGGSAAGDDRITIAGEIDALVTSGTQVAVDFTHPDAVMGNVAWLLEHGIHAVVGTTGLTDANLDAIRSAAERDGGHVLVAPNFAIGAVLMMRFAAEAARYLPHAEIIELHHDNKADAPSGTAITTAHRMAEARRGDPSRTRESTEAVPGARGGAVDQIPIHSVRLPGLVAHQEVLFGGQGQTLSIRHDSIDRTSFMPGVLMAIKGVGARPGLTVGLDALLDG